MHFLTFYRLWIINNKNNKYVYNFFLIIPVETFQSDEQKNPKRNDKYTYKNKIYKTWQ